MRPACFVVRLASKPRSFESYAPVARTFAISNSSSSFCSQDNARRAARSLPVAYAWRKPTIWRRGFVDEKRPPPNPTQYEVPQAGISDQQIEPAGERSPGQAPLVEDHTDKQLRASRLEGIARATETAVQTPPSTQDTPAPSSKTATGTSQPLIDPSNDIHNAMLPSYTAGQRSVMVARFQTAMEQLLERLNIASQRVNTYTGTDYSGIEALRSSIIRLEGLSKDKLNVVSSAKEAHAAAMAAQTASQKEVVQLLERKHSWSAPDLERYMTLIRSEHVNDQAVQAARDGVTAAERELEDLRARLEKYERRQYHEEQIWSDTIRRNSTWVTFGLMGLNILLLLVSLVAIEPWRRRRLVREMKSALDERTIAVPAAAAVVTAASAPVAVPAADPSPVEQATGQQVDAVLASEVSATLKPTVSTGTAVTLAAPSDPLSMRELEPEPEPEVATALSQLESLSSAHDEPSQPSAAPASPPSFTLWAGTWTDTFESYRTYWADLFSERRMTLRRVDLTAVVLEGVAAGAACMGLLFVLLRPR